jgi:hypothetical protein
MPWSNRERAREQRDDRLRHLRDQVSSGALVIRQMTASEQALCVFEREKRYASMTAEERARCEAFLRERRRRAAFLGGPTAEADEDR